LIRTGTATRIGGRKANADAVAVEQNPLGLGVAVVDGIGSSEAVCNAARRAAEQAAIVASHRDAQAGMMAAAETMPSYAGAPNAVAAVVSVDLGRRIEIAHVGDAAVWTWGPAQGLKRWTVDQTVGEHLRHMLGNPGLTAASRGALNQALTEQVVSVMDDYVLNGLTYATVSTIAWTPLRDEDQLEDLELVLLTSDGVHKALSPKEIEYLVCKSSTDPDALADALVDAAVVAGREDADEVADNATAAVIMLRDHGLGSQQGHAEIDDEVHGYNP